MIMPITWGDDIKTRGEENPLCKDQLSTAYLLPEQEKKCHCGKTLWVDALGYICEEHGRIT